LEQLNYNEQDHALARSEGAWRWAEIRQGQIKDAQRRQALFLARQPGKAQIAANARIEQELIPDCAKQIAAIERYIAEIGYDTEQHNPAHRSARLSRGSCAINSYLRPAISPVTAAIAGSYPAFKPD